MILFNGKCTNAQKVVVSLEYYDIVRVFIQHLHGHLSMYWLCTVKSACTSLMITQKQE